MSGGYHAHWLRAWSISANVSHQEGTVPPWAWSNVPHQECMCHMWQLPTPIKLTLCFHIVHNGIAPSNVEHSHVSSSYFRTWVGQCQCCFRATGSDCWAGNEDTIFPPLNTSRWVALRVGDTDGACGTNGKSYIRIQWSTCHSWCIYVGQMCGCVCADKRWVIHSSTRVDLE